METRLHILHKRARTLKISGISALFVGLVVCFSEVCAKENGSEKEKDFGNPTDEQSMSGQEQIQWIKGQIVSSGSALSEVQKMLDQAMKAKDAVKIMCLDDKYTQMNVSMQGATDRLELLQKVVAENDSVSAKQQFAILKVYFSKIKGLESESGNCLGEADVALGKTRTAMLMLGEMTEEDPSEEDIVDNFGLEQPTHMSAYY